MNHIWLWLQRVEGAIRTSGNELPAHSDGGSGGCPARKRRNSREGDPLMNRATPCAIRGGQAKSREKPAVDILGAIRGDLSVEHDDADKRKEEPRQRIS